MPTTGDMPLQDGARPPSAALGDDWLGEAGAVAFFTYLAACLTVAYCTLLFAIFPHDGRLVMREDGPVENFTALAYLLAGLALSAMAVRRRGLPRLALAMLAALMVFICGEEISWGQRILGFATQTHGEATLHNQRHLRRAVDLGNVAFFLIPCVAAWAGAMGRRDTWFGVPLPSLPVVLVGLAAVTLGPWKMFGFVVGEPGAWWWSVPLLALGAYAAVARRRGLLLAAAATQALCTAFSYVDHHPAPLVNRELQELLLGLFWLGYAGEAVVGAKRGGGIERLGHFPASNWAGLLTGALAVAVGLIAVEHFGARDARAHAIVEEARRLAKIGETGAPAGPVAFDVKLHRGRVSYFKHPCERADIDAGKFFLHVRPQDPTNLPKLRREPWAFVNRDFSFVEHGALIADTCGAVVPLPDYPIARIDTGQYTSAGRLWEVEVLEVRLP